MYILHVQVRSILSIQFSMFTLITWIFCLRCFCCWMCWLKIAASILFAIYHLNSHSLSNFMLLCIYLICKYYYLIEFGEKTFWDKIAESYTRPEIPPVSISTSQNRLKKKKKQNLSTLKAFVGVLGKVLFY